MPTDDEVHVLLQAVITRLMKMLTRRGVLVEDMGQTYLAESDTDGDESLTLRPLQAAAITYEEVGLLPAPSWADSEQRFYDERDVARLLFIRRCRALGFHRRKQACQGAVADRGIDMSGVQRALEDILRTGDQAAEKECKRLRVLS